ncbi:hypothetical protein K435DRAFT_803099 [Dendrothele bispora CBS 962.96]|uniref:Uncharacterized protein n=1 Tax=Dendrothele bispora (strain CBS 962.96) TaxID=1314807 RepID=A0A4S8LIQ3_DENBC|nr:hypothetical protein K435DRAFT_803099 [Dendrothele bispora CBS 962.96]
MHHNKQIWEQRLNVLLGYKIKDDSANFGTGIKNVQENAGLGNITNKSQDQVPPGNDSVTLGTRMDSLGNNNDPVAVTGYRNFESQNQNPSGNNSILETRMVPDNTPGNNLIVVTSFESAGNQIQNSPRRLREYDYSLTC